MSIQNIFRVNMRAAHKVMAAPKAKSVNPISDIRLKTFVPAAAMCKNGPSAAVIGDDQDPLGRDRFQ